MVPESPAPTTTAFLRFPRLVFRITLIVEFGATGLDVENAHRFDAIGAGLRVEQLAVVRCRHAGKADEAPARLVAVAAVDRIAEEAFFGISPEHSEKQFCRQRR